MINFIKRPFDGFFGKGLSAEYAIEDILTDLYQLDNVVDGMEKRITELERHVYGEGLKKV